jgi:glycerophosphoryl diester phosphodiesterase
LTRIIGHGPVDGTGAPINVMASYPECRAAGVDGVELDLRLTRDGALVVIHDPDLPDGRAVAETRVDLLPPEVPLLEQVLDATRGLVVNVEIKNHPRDPAWDPDQTIVSQLVDLLAARSWTDEVLVSCFEVATIDCLQELAAGVPTALLYFSRRPADELLSVAVGHGHRVVHPYDTMVDEVFMRTARSLSLAVNVWLADDAPPSRLGDLVALGVDGLITPQISAARAATGV